MRRKPLPKTIVGLITALLCFGIGWSASWGMGSNPSLLGSSAPSFQLTNLAGEKDSLEQYREKVVLPNFRATWCQTCTKEMPAMRVAYDALHDQGFVVLAINELEEIFKVQEHIAEHQHTFEVLLDPDNHVANQYGVVGLPVCIFIDKTGRVHKIAKGGLEQGVSFLTGIRQIL